MTYLKKSRYWPLYADCICDSYLEVRRTGGYDGIGGGIPVNVEAAPVAAKVERVQVCCRVLCSLGDVREVSIVLETCIGWVTGRPVRPTNCGIVIESHHGTRDDSARLEGPSEAGGSGDVVHPYASGVVGEGYGKGQAV